MLEPILFLLKYITQTGIYSEAYLISVSQGKLKLNGHPVKEYKLLDPAPGLQDIHILHIGGAHIPMVIWSSNE